MKIAVTAEVPADKKNVGEQLRTGTTIRQSLLADDTPDGLNFTVNRTEWLPDSRTNTTPRHHHAFQQIRWAESGSVNFAPDQDISERDIAYFPRGTWYGPQLRDQGISVTIQFGFHGEKQHGSSFWKRYEAEAMARLKARGTFQEGSYIEADPVTGEKQQRDAVQALYEEQYALHTNQKFVVPPEGYAAPILMHPAAFDYYTAAPGVEIKQLGRFYDHPGPDGDVALAMVRLSKGGTYIFDSRRAQVAWTITAGLQIDGKIYPEGTYLYIPRDERAVIASSDCVELYVVEFPRLDPSPER